MTITRRTLSLTSASASTSNGVFTAEVKWTMSVNFDEDVVSVLPDRIAKIWESELPLTGSPYPGNPFCTCRTVSAKTSNTPGVYEFTAKYSDANSSTEDEDKDGSTNENPLLDSPIIRSMSSMNQRAITRDRDDKAILNTAGDPLKASKMDNTIGFQISQSVAGIPGWLLGMRNSLNDSPIRVAGLYIDTEQARFILPSGWLSEKKSRNDIDYYDFNYEILIDERDEHAAFPLNAGFRELVPGPVFGDPGVLKTITEKDGSEPSDPVPLGLDGLKIENPTPDNAIFQRIDRYELRDFTQLPGVYSG